MTEKIKQLVKEELYKLPKEMQQVIDTFEWEKIVEESCKKNNITEDKIFPIQIETVLVLIGLEFPEVYAKHLEENAELTKEEAEIISKEVLVKIFDAMAKNLEELIKKDLNNKVTTWQQNLDFILSGGDYTVFIKRQKAIQYATGGKGPNDSKFDDLKSKFTI